VLIQTPQSGVFNLQSLYLILCRYLSFTIRFEASTPTSSLARFEYDRSRTSCLTTAMTYRHFDRAGRPRRPRISFSIYIRHNDLELLKVDLSADPSISMNGSRHAERRRVIYIYIYIYIYIVCVYVCVCALHIQLYIFINTLNTSPLRVCYKLQTFENAS